jgi:hypothetical protein
MLIRACHYEIFCSIIYQIHYTERRRDIDVHVYTLLVANQLILTVRNLTQNS